MKKLSKIAILLLVVIFMIMPNALAYSNEYFKMDLPEEYGCIEYQKMNLWNYLNAVFCSLLLKINQFKILTIIYKTNRWKRVIGEYYYDWDFI